ncbi:hypothetical protein BHM03_00030835 [Ensete ventricosum]|nr:hypothetical protein BHM03_00030835 [Ensete ventricosum]
MAALLSLTCVVSPKPSLPVPSQRSNARWRWESVASRVASQPERRRSRVVALVSRASRVVFRDLDADDFRHPLDKQNTLLLRTIPGLNELGKALLVSKLAVYIFVIAGPMTEQVMLLENIGTSVLVSENQVGCLQELSI